MRSTMPDELQQADGGGPSGAVGQRLGDLFKLDTPATLVTHKLRMSQMAVTELRADNPVLGRVPSVPREDAYLICFILKDLKSHEVWESDRPCPRYPVAAGQFQLRDLKREQSALVEEPHHSLQIYIPRAALDDIAHQEEARRIGELRYRPGVPISDRIVASLGFCLSHVFSRAHEANRLFFEHIALALGIHMAREYGGLDPHSRAQRGGLSPWQERRAKELLSSDLGGDLSLEEVAAQCGLTTRHFSRAFRDTTGLAPHQWFLARRVEVAKAALRSRHVSLAEVALECGFADQSHFTRVFSRIVGTTPGAWRRTCEIRAPEAQEWTSNRM